MKLLLDSHVWVWMAIEPTRLSKQAATAVKDPENELFLSPISAWETMMLAQAGQIEVDGEPDSWVRSLLRNYPVLEAALTREVAIRSRTIELEHEDPADRFIAATADVHELTLVTADSRLLSSGLVRTLAA